MLNSAQFQAGSNTSAVFGKESELPPQSGKSVCGSVTTLRSGVARLIGFLGRGAARLSYPVRKPISDYATKTGEGVLVGAVLGGWGTYVCVSETVQNSGLGSVIGKGMGIGASLIGGPVGTLAGFAYGSCKGGWDALKGTLTLRNTVDAFSKKEGAEPTLLELSMAYLVFRKQG